MPTSPAPDSMTDHAEWLLAMYDWPNKVSIRDYHNPTDTKASRTVIIEATRHLSTGLRSKVLTYEQQTEDEEIVNHFFFSEDAKTFWKNGLDTKQTPADILAGWEAMQSMLAEVTKSEADSAAT